MSIYAGTPCPDKSHSPRVRRGWFVCPDCDAARAAEAEQRTLDEWAIFLKALRVSVRDDGTVHVNDVRPKVRGRIEPKHIGTFWRRARSEGLIAHKGWEQSTDHAGANADKQSRVYDWKKAAT